MFNWLVKVLPVLSGLVASWSIKEDCCNSIKCVSVVIDLQEGAKGFVCFWIDFIFENCMKSMLCSVALVYSNLVLISVKLSIF